jgi:copper resistance protein B
MGAGSAGVVLGLLGLALPHRAGAQGIGLEQLLESMDWGRETYVLAEVLEFAPDGVGRPVRYDLLGWAGGASNRVWVKADGEHGTRNGGGETELQLLYGRLLSPWWDGQVGVLVDAHYGEGSTSTRTSLVLGVQGLAPGWFEVEPALFVSQHGDVSASLEASYDLLFTQRLVLQPRLETTVALQDVPEFGVGSGFNDVELGMRLRYEILRTFAPYVGFSWARRLGGTADLAHASGEPIRELSLVAGVRAWR